jgi:signal transduction histidine kinase
LTTISAASTNALAAWPLRLLRWVRYAYVAPFRSNLPHYGDRQRRADYLRVTVLSITFIELGLGLPVSLVTASSASFAVLAVITFDIGCLWLNEHGQTNLASFLYLAAILVLIYSSIIRGVAGSEEATIGLLFFLNVFLLLGALVLPSWAIWGLGGLILFTSEAIIWLLPPSVVVGSDHSSNLLPNVSGFIGLVYVLTTVLAWLAARGNKAGIERLTRAVEEELQIVALKDLFILSANHELRTPIMTLCINLELLTQTLEQSTPQDRQEMLARALRAGRDLQGMLGNVLDAGVTAPQIAAHLRYETLSVREVVRQALTTFDPGEVGEIGIEQALLLERSVTMDIPPELHMYADGARVRQVLLNLLANAVKYSAPGTPLEISARDVSPASFLDGEATTDGWVQISVRDWGHGIPLNEQRHLFQRFVRLERDIASATRGTGVGLYLCKLVVEAMGGKIWIESTGVPGEGSAFIFLVPLIAAESASM